MLEGGEFRAIIYNAARENNLTRLKVFLDEPRSPEWIHSCLNDVSNEKIPLVIAARYGYHNVVDYLISKGADPTVRGTVSFDGEIISFAPALWSAAAAGHLEVVKYLVQKAGVDINQPTATNSTPLRGACYDGHLDIGVLVNVEFLLENGADMEVSNKHGHSCLMIAAYRGKTQVAKYLLERGADVHRQSYKGNTALHDAAEGDRADICEVLINAGATLKEDDSGLCPLMSSAMLGNDKTLSILMPICQSSSKRRDVLKILGCTLCDKKMNMLGAVRAWKAAVTIPLTAEEQQKLKESNNFVIPEVYGEIKELETVADVVAIEGQPDLIHMQSLLIRERVLGGSHTDVHYYIRFRGAVYCDLGRMEKCMALWLHSLHLQQKYLPPLNMSTLATFQAFQETYAMAANEHRIHQELGRQQWPVEVDQVRRILDMLCYELERYSDWPEDQPLHDDCCEIHESNPEADKEKLVLVALHLILLIKRLTTDDTVPTVDARRLVKACRSLDLLPLHLALQESIDRVDPQIKDEFPSLYVVSQLLKSGAEVDTIDNIRNTPLHVLLLNERPRESIVRLLLEAEAPIMARNEEDNTCLDLLELSGLGFIDHGQYISLMGLAANAVNRSGNSCLALDILPQDLHKFLTIH